MINCTVWAKTTLITFERCCSCFYFCHTFTTFLHRLTAFFVDTSFVTNRWNKKKYFQKWATKILNAKKIRHKSYVRNSVRMIVLYWLASIYHFRKSFAFPLNHREEHDLQYKKQCNCFHHNPFLMFVNLAWPGKCFSFFHIVDRQTSRDIHILLVSCKHHHFYMGVCKQLIEKKSK